MDAGPVSAKVLLQKGRAKSVDPGGIKDPITLHDVYIRVGGPHVGKADVSLQVNSNNILIDNTWVWRADHGWKPFDETKGFAEDNDG